MLPAVSSAVMPGDVAENLARPVAPALPLLSYGRPSFPVRRWLRRAFYLGWIAGFCWLAYDKWGVEARLVGKIVVAQHDCLTHDEPADRVVIDLDPTRVPGLSVQSGYHFGKRGPNFASATIGSGPRVSKSTGSAVIYEGMDALRQRLEQAGRHWEAYQKIKAPSASALDIPIDLFTEYLQAPLPDERFVLFLHERSTGDRPSRLVTLIGGWVASLDGVTLEGYVAEKAYLRSGRALTGGAGEPRGTVLRVRSPDKTPYLRLFAGQADPDDASRFTVRYESSAGNGTIEGRLTGDDTVMLRVLDGPVKDGF